MQISEAIEGVGGNMNAATDHEHTNYRALVPYNYLDTAMEVMTDMLRGSRFMPEEIAREREVIIEEINSTYDSPANRGAWHTAARPVPQKNIRSGVHLCFIPAPFSGSSALSVQIRQG